MKFNKHTDTLVNGVRPGFLDRESINLRTGHTSKTQT
jgi:hypothetical protein